MKVMDLVMYTQRGHGSGILICIASAPGIVDDALGKVIGNTSIYSSRLIICIQKSFYRRDLFAKRLLLIGPCNTMSCIDSGKVGGHTLIRHEYQSESSQCLACATWSGPGQ